MFSVQALEQYTHLKFYALAGILFLLGFKIIISLSVAISRHRIAKQNGCQPCRRYSQTVPVIGIDVMKTWLVKRRAHKFLEHIQSSLREYGNTHTFTLKGKPSEFSPSSSSCF